MKRSTGALLLSLVSTIGVALVWTAVLPWGGSIVSVVAGFVGSFLGFVAIGDSDRRSDDVIAWVGALLGAAATLIGSGLFLGPLLSTPSY